MERKKIVIIALCICICAVALAGCNEDKNVSGQPEDAFAVYEEINNKIGMFSSIEAQLSTSCFANDGKESLQLNMTSQIRQEKNADSGIEMEMVTAVRYLDNTDTVNSYYGDGYFYTDFGGEKIKYQISGDTIIKDSNLSLLELKKSAVKEGNLEYDQEGNRTITLIADADKLRNTVERYVRGFMSDDMKNVEFSDITLVVRADKDNIIQSCDSLIAINCVLNEAAIEYTIDTYIEYSGINEKIDVVIPDPDEYREVTE